MRTAAFVGHFGTMESGSRGSDEAAVRLMLPDNRDDLSELDLFVSYAGPDQAWAEWIAWQLEDVGLNVFVQAWDSVPGSNWTNGTSLGLKYAERTLAVVSSAYLESVHSNAEWEAAYRGDPNGLARRLIPVRIEDCPRPVLLGGVVSFDLFGLTAERARTLLLERIGSALAGRAKPGTEPAFPGAIHTAVPGQSTNPSPAFPGDGSAGPGGTSVDPSPSPVTVPTSSSPLSRPRRPRDSGSPPVLPETGPLVDLPRFEFRLGARPRHPDDKNPPIEEWVVDVVPNMGDNNRRPWTSGRRPFDEDAMFPVRAAAGFAGRQAQAIVDALELVDAEGAVESVVLRARNDYRFVEVAVVLSRSATGLRASLPSSELPNQWEEVRTLLATKINISSVDVLTAASSTRRVSTLLSMFTGARARAAHFLEGRLVKAAGHYVATRVRTNGEVRAADGLSALDAWAGRAGGSKFAVVLGGFGTGKSTLLAKWASTPTDTLRVLCRLRLAEKNGDLLDLVVQETGTESTPGTRAAARLLIRAGLLVPLFDGFDEWRADAVPSDIPAMLTSIFAFAAHGGRVLLASRDNYFHDTRTFEVAVQEAIPDPAKSSSGCVRFDIELFDQNQISELVHKVRGLNPHESLERIAAIYPLVDLVRRPLLLGIVLDSLDLLDPRATVSTADVYEQYLAGWLEQTGPDEILSPKQKEFVAERLAAHLWRQGRLGCPASELDGMVREVLARELPEDRAVGSVVLENLGGSFYGRTGDLFEFAHRSFQEFFLARHLLRAATDTPFDALDTEPFTAEVVDFVAELIDRDRGPATDRGPAKDSAPLVSIRTWLVAGRRAEAGNDEKINRTARAASNAVTLLYRLRARAADPNPWEPAGADLRQVSLAAAQLPGIFLAGADLSGAVLTSADLTDAVLRESKLVAASLTGARLDGADLARSSLRRADLAGCAAHGADLEDADLSDAVLDRSMWTDCEWTGATVEATAATLAGFLGRDPPTGEFGWSPLADASWRIARGHEGAVLSVDWSVDGARLATAGADGTVRIWSTATQNITHVLTCRRPVCGVAWSPVSALLASGGDDSTVRLWDSTTGALLQQCRSHRGPVHAVGFSPDGEYLVSASNDGTVRVWEVATGLVSRVLVGHEAPVLSVAWSPDGKHIAAGGADRVVRVWNSADGSPSHVLRGHNDRIRSIAWSPDGRRVAAGGEDGAFYVWSLSDSMVRGVLTGNRVQVLAVAWSPDGRAVAVAFADGTVAAWDNDLDAELFHITAHEGRASSTSFAPTGRRLASTGADGTVKIWTVPTGELFHKFDGHHDQVWSTCWSPDGRRLASGSGDGTVRIWDLVTGRMVAALGGHDGRVRSVAWSPDGKLLASGGHDGVVQLWNPVTGELRYTFSAHRGQLQFVTWLDAGTRLAVVGENSAVRVLEFDGHQGHFQTISDDRPPTRDASQGRRVTTGDDDRVVAVVDRSNNRGGSVALVGHEHPITGYAWSSDGTRLATADSAGTMMLWNVATGTLVGTLRGPHSGRVRAISWSPWDDRVLSGGDEGDIGVWDVRSERLVATLSTRESTWLTSCGWIAQWGGNRHEIALAVKNPASTDSTLYTQPGRLLDLCAQGNLIFVGLSAVPPSPKTLLPDSDWLDGHSWDGRAAVLSSGGHGGGHDDPPPRTEGMSTGFRPGPALATTHPPGRGPIISDVAALVGHGSPVVLRGPRRAGKTSVLIALAHQLGGRMNVYHESLEGSRIGTPDDLARLLEPRVVSSVDAAGEFRRQLQQDLVRGRPSAVLLDEVVHLLNTAPETFAWLRSLGQDGIGIILTGTRAGWDAVVTHAGQLGVSFGNDVTPVELGPLTREAAVEFLRSAAAPVVDLKADETIEWILARCGTWPFYLQVMGFAVVRSVEEGDTTVLHSSAAIDDLYQTRLLGDRDHVFRNRWDELPRHARTALLRTGATPPATADLTQQESRACVLAGLLTRHPDSFGCWIDDRPLFDWIVWNQVHLGAESHTEL